MNNVNSAVDSINLEDGKINRIHARRAEPCLKLEDITSSIAQRAIRSANSDGKLDSISSIRMVALVFSPFGSAITRKQILPRFSDIHVRSRDFIDFYFAGIDKSNSLAWRDFGDKMQLGALTVEDDEKVDWSYSSSAFDNLRQEVEFKTQDRWNYSGESDLLLLNAYLDKNSNWAIDFRRVLFISLWHALKDEAVDTVPILFENIIRYREKNKFTGIWEWSDGQLKRKGAVSFMVGVIGMLPSPLQNLWHRGKHFAVTNT